MRRGLYPKIVLLLAGFLTLALAALLAFVYTMTSQQIEGAGLEKAETLNRLAFETLYTSMSLGGGRAGNREVIGRLRQVEGITGLRVVKGEPVRRQFGAELDELPRDELERRALAGEEVQRVEQADGYRVVRYATPIFVRSECQRCHQAALGEVNGAVVTTVSLAEHDLALARWRDLLVLAVVAVLAALGGLSFLALRRLVLAPLAQMREGASAIAAGDLDFRLHLPTGDELEETAQAFNKMARRLQESHAHLEEKVSQRTRQLQEQAATLQELKDQLLAENRKLERANRELRVFQELGAAMWTTMDVADMQERVLTCLVEGLDVERAAIGLVDPSGEALTGWLALSKGEEDLAPFDLPHTARLPIHLADSRWQIADSSRLSAISHQPSAISHRLSAISHRPVVVLPMMRQGQLVGVILVEGSREGEVLGEAEMATLARLADQAALALSSVQACMIKAQKLAAAAERQRIAADIHDGVIQSLFGLVLGLEGCLNLLPGQPRAAQERLQDLRALAFKTLTEARGAIYDLWPSAFGRDELVAALRRLVYDWAQLNGLSIAFTVIGDGDNLHEEVAKAIFRIAQEALCNVVQHAEAQEASLELSFGPRTVALIVQDDGKGFNRTGVLAGAERGDGMGLMSMRERTAHFGGTLEVTSTPGQGTRIAVELPLRVKGGGRGDV